MPTAKKSYKFISATDRKAWDEFITSHQESNFLQSWDFYDFHASRGNVITRRIAVNSRGRIVAAYAGVVETARRGVHLAVAGGPILDWSNESLVEATFADLRSEGRRLNCAFVRLRPQLELSANSLALFRRFSARPAPMYLSVEHAGVLDLTKSEDELLKNMRQRLRRALRKAEKNHITVETSTDPADVHQFYQIQLETAARHDFYAFKEDFLTKQFAAFAKSGSAVLYTAKYEGQILAQNFMIFYGAEASYHYGVSSELGTKLSGAPLLHLAAMRDAKARGLTRYNLWGIVPEDATRHRFYGVSNFKRGFGVTELKYLPAHDLVLRPLPYLKTLLIETFRRRLRHV